MNTDEKYEEQDFNQNSYSENTENTENTEQDIDDPSKKDKKGKNKKGKNKQSISDGSKIGSLLKEVAILNKKTIGAKGLLGAQFDKIQKEYTEAKLKSAEQAFEILNLTTQGKSFGSPTDFFGIVENSPIFQKLYSSLETVKSLYEESGETTAKKYKGIAVCNGKFYNRLRDPDFKELFDTEDEAVAYWKEFDEKEKKRKAKELMEAMKEMGDGE